MQKLTVTICAFATMITAAYGGTTTYSGKEMKQVEQVPPCPEWYRDTEWNVSLWGTYVFTANNWQDDRYFQSDHAWGGGVDIKYFFHRYFGVGLEGWATESTRQQFDGFDFNGQPVFSDDERVIGAVKGTLTLRYPIAAVSHRTFTAVAARSSAARSTIPSPTCFHHQRSRPSQLVFPPLTPAAQPEVSARLERVSRSVSPRISAG